MDTLVRGMLQSIGYPVDLVFRSTDEEHVEDIMRCLYTLLTQRKVLSHSFIDKQKNERSITDSTARLDTCSVYIDDLELSVGRLNAKLVKSASEYKALFNRSEYLFIRIC